MHREQRTAGNSTVGSFAATHRATPRPGGTDLTREPLISGPRIGTENGVGSINELSHEHWSIVAVFNNANVKSDKIEWMFLIPEEERAALQMATYEYGRVITCQRKENYGYVLLAKLARAPIAWREDWGKSGHASRGKR